MLRLKWNILKLAHAIDVRRRDCKVKRNQLMRKSNRPRARLKRSKARQKPDPFDIPDEEFVKTFRLAKETVRQLMKDLTPLIPGPRRNDGISIETKILVALAFYASGSFQTSVGRSVPHSVSQNTVSRAVRQVTAALNDVFANYIKWPTQFDERNEIKDKFHQKFGIPGVLGCIGSTHVVIRKPHAQEEPYHNRKGFHSLNVMIICDSDLNIMCVEADNPGSIHVSSVWQSHALGQHLIELNNNGEQVFLLGDTGYTTGKTMMTPILNAAEGSPEHNYNLMHESAHSTVKCCIEVLKARFRCLLGAPVLHYDPMAAGKIISACCVLHNIANNAGAPVPQLTHKEAQTEALRQQQTCDDEHSSRAELENTIEALGSQSVNQDLFEGQALQQTLVDELWRNALDI